MGMQLEDFLNAEVATGSVTNLHEALEWVALTYWGALQKTVSELSDYVYNTMESLHAKRMINLTDTMCSPTDLGRIAAKNYVSVDTIEMWQDKLAQIADRRGQAISGYQILQLFASATEFKNAKIKDDEESELNLMKDRLKSFTSLKIPLMSGQDKISCLVLVYIAKMKLQSFALTSDLLMIADSAGRLFRALFETCLVQNFSLMAKGEVNPSVAYKVLEWCKMVEWRQWGALSGCTLPYIHPLRHFIQPPPSHQTKFLSDAVSANRVGGGAGLLKLEILDKLENRRKIDSSASVDTLYYMSEAEVAESLKLNRPDASRVLNFIYRLPYCDLSAVVRPLVDTAARVDITIHPDWTWDDRWHGVNEKFHLWITNMAETVFFHKAELTITKDNIIQSTKEGVGMSISVVIPLHDLDLEDDFEDEEGRPSSTKGQLKISLSSDKWLDCFFDYDISVASLIKPSKPRHTDLLPLPPLPISVFNDEAVEDYYSNVKKLHFLNPVQTQVFHSIFHSDTNVLVGAPTGSGKTLIAEMAILRLLRTNPGKKAVYVAPLKALARERLHDWKEGFGEILGLNVVELSGDTTPDLEIIKRSDIIITTPEKWDGVSRLWRSRSYVLDVGLMIFDEIHLLGQDRGAVIEVLVSRANSISKIVGEVNFKCRLMGLSTALSNAQDVADWMNVSQQGLFNFRPAVRPVPLRTMIRAFPEKHFCPRMASMNRPAFLAIEQHSPTKPVLIFVASRRQTRLTAADLAVLAINHRASGHFKLREPTREEERLIDQVEDKNLKLSLQMGIGAHHAGLNEKDRDLAVQLFAAGLTQVLVCTATLAWGVNLPAHLVIIKGTDVFDGDLGRYVDMPLTDVLQMLGRAGRPQFDNEAVGCVFVHSPKKDFYQKFLYEPFPVESALLERLSDHLNAEIAGGVVRSMKEAIDWLSQTYFFRRLSANPSFYCPMIFNGQEETEEKSLNDAVGVGDASVVNPFWDSIEISSAIKQHDQKTWDEKRGAEQRKLAKYLESVIKNAIADLVESKCIRVNTKLLSTTDDAMIESTACGRLASLYYLKHETIRLLHSQIQKSQSKGEQGLGVLDVLKLLANAPEFSAVPVRHSEDEMLEEMSKLVPFVDPRLDPDASSPIPWGSPVTKCFYMLQAHLFGLPLPIIDFAIDLKKVLDSTLRVLQSVGDLALALNSMTTVLSTVRLLQYISQGTYSARNPLYSLPNCALSDEQVSNLVKAGESLPSLVAVDASKENESQIVRLNRIAEKHLGWSADDWLEQSQFLNAVRSLPDVEMSFRLLAVGQKKKTQKEIDEALAQGFVEDAGVVLTNVDGEVHMCAADTDLELEVRIRCLNSPTETAQTPLFPKGRRAGWWVIVGDESIDEVAGVKKVSLVSNGESVCRITFAAPHEHNSGPHELKIYLMSDCYVGLDQVKTLKVKTF
eukprot:GDKJ01017972.1.p1 GENE.GDKJ01017972.1~~GDKJ01017972.1.p1  ORF type:complete len:1669 (-),score=435.88 GDKJ01017972.1:67-4344(-)